MTSWRRRYQILKIINNQPVWQKHVKEMGEMEPIVKKYKEYKKAKSDLAEAKEMLDEGDEEMRELAKMEISELEDTIKQQEADLKILLLPKDPNDDKERPHPGDPCRRRRRGGGVCFACRRLPDVCATALRRAEPLEEPS